MKSITKFFLLVILLLPIQIFAQNKIKFWVVDSVTHESLIGVSISIDNSTSGDVTDVNGFATISTSLSGSQHFSFSYLGYSTFHAPFFVSNNDTVTHFIFMSEEKKELGEIRVSTTRTNSRIDDLPIKVEVLGQEEMEEESALVPGGVGSILGDLSIITIQRTNAVNGNDAVRMQGIDARYTQLMRDGLPLYGGFSGSLGVLAIPPLDLKQVEIIKGSASTLYGGGAIGGLINFISKTPTDSPQVVLTGNATTLKEFNFNSFISKRKNKMGTTLFCGATAKQATDINSDGISEVPLEQSFTFHPRLFFYLNKKDDLNVGFNSTYNNRIGGDMQAILNHPDSSHSFYEKENTFRNAVDLHFEHQQNRNLSLSLKTAGSSFSRQSDYSGFLFKANQYNSYSELSSLYKRNKNTLVVGVNFISESFEKNKKDTLHISNFTNTTVGGFIQDDWQVLPKISLQAGLRYDVTNHYNQFLLPRFAIFIKPSKPFTVRLAVGTGYKTPNLFDFVSPSPLLSDFSKTIKPEQSYGVNADISYHRFMFNKIGVQIDQAFYFTEIKNVISASLQNNYLTIVNSSNTTTSIGSDTYIRLKYDDLELYLGYNHTEAYLKTPVWVYNLPFNPRDKFSSTLAYEIEGKWRMGVEAAYTANQFIYNNERVHDFLFMALMVERKIKKTSIVLNCENVLDSRQSKYESLYSGSITNPQFRPIWGQLEGRVINLSVKVAL